MQTLPYAMVGTDLASQSGDQRSIVFWAYDPVVEALNRSNPGLQESETRHSENKELAAKLQAAEAALDRQREVRLVQAWFCDVNHTT